MRARTPKARQLCGLGGQRINCLYEFLPLLLLCLLLLLLLRSLLLSLRQGGGARSCVSHWASGQAQFGALPPGAMSAVERPPACLIAALLLLIVFGRRGFRR
jgi:hypothetical protein